MNLFRCTLLTILLFASNPTFATTMLAGFSFEDSAFADRVISTSGDISFVGPSLVGSIVGSNLDTYVHLPTEPRTGSTLHLELGFDDNAIVNGPGDDLVLFELFRGDDFLVSLTVGGPAILATTAPSGFVNAGGFNVGVALVNLDLLGVSSGEAIDRIVLYRGAEGAGPELAVVGALNSAAIPEPSTLLLLGSGLGLLGVMRVLL